MVAKKNVFLCHKSINLNMKSIKTLRSTSLACALLLWLTACHSTYTVTSSTGRRIVIDEALDAAPDSGAIALLAPYQAKVDSVMTRPLGEAAEDMERSRPEGALTRLVADILRLAATEVLGHPADVAFMNAGGIRTTLTKGTISYGTALELLPFDNSLCVLTMKGSALMAAFDDVARLNGNGVSGATLRISPQYKAKNVRVGGRPIDPERLYTVATIDYLADGNDGMGSLIQYEERTCPPGRTLRQLFVEYVERETAAGRTIKAPAPGRILVEQ